METLFSNKRYAHSLFFGHLYLEKLIKALYAKVTPDNPVAPKIHNLRFLAEKCGLTLDKERKAQFEAITRFNMDSRYQEEKQDFYQLCTREYTEKQIIIIKECAKWIKKLLAK